MVCGWGQSPATPPAKLRCSDEMLRCAAQQFPFVCFDGSFIQGCQCSIALMPLFCWCCGTGGCRFWCCHFSLCTLQWPCLRWLKVVWQRTLVSSHCVFVCASQNRRFEALWSPAAMSEKCKSTSLVILGSTSVDPYIHACTRVRSIGTIANFKLLQNTSAPWVFLLCMAHFQNKVTNQRQKPHALKPPPKWETGEFMLSNGGRWPQG